MIRLCLTLFIVFSAAPAFAWYAVATDCGTANPVFDISGYLFNQMVDGDVTGWEVVLEQAWVGTCNETMIVAAWDLPAYLTEGTFTAQIPVPEENQYFLYTARIRSNTGIIQNINAPSTQSYTAALCGQAPAARGYLTYDTSTLQHSLEACDASCATWLCAVAIDASAIAPAQLQTFVDSGIPVDLFGILGPPTPMLGDPCLIASGIAATTDGSCVPVDVPGISWGRLKAQYR